MPLGPGDGGAGGGAEGDSTWGKFCDEDLLFNVLTRVAENGYGSVCVLSGVGWLNKGAWNDEPLWDALSQACSSSRGYDERTPLMYHSHAGSVERAQWLLERGARPNGRTRKEGFSALHWAAQAGHAHVVALLLRKGASPDLHSGSGISPMHYAGWKGHVPVLEALISGGAELDGLSFSGASALMFSVWNRHLPATQYLLARGSRVDLQDSGGITCLMKCGWQVSSEIMEVLLVAGADPNLRTPLLWTALHSACRSGEGKSVALLLGGGADAEAESQGGWLPIHEVCQAGGEDALLICQALLDRAPHTHSSLTTLTSKSPLTLACEGGFPALCQELISRGADVNLRGVRHPFNTPHFSTQKGGGEEGEGGSKLRVLTTLLAWGANAHDAVSDITPLQWCMTHGLIDCAILLLFA